MSAAAAANVIPSPEVISSMIRESLVATGMVLARLRFATRAMLPDGVGLIRPSAENEARQASEN
jgi:hypothetical protein